MAVCVFVCAVCGICGLLESCVFLACPILVWVIAMLFLHYSEFIGLGTVDSLNCCFCPTVPCVRTKTTTK